MKTKKVAGIDLQASSFAFVGDEKDTSTWKMPIHFPGDSEKTINHIKNALYRFASLKDIPDAQRVSVWATICGAARAHGLKAGPQPASVLPGSTHPETVKPLDAEEQEMKAARALGALHAERFLKSIGYGGTDEEHSSRQNDIRNAIADSRKANGRRARHDSRQNAVLVSAEKEKSSGQSHHEISERV